MIATPPAVNTFPPAVSDAVEGAATAFFRGACGLTHVPDAEIDDDLVSAGIMSTISFVGGDLQWAFALAFPEDAAVSIARTFAGFDIPFDSPDMGDVIGEIVNVIAGDVVGRLAKQKITAQMSLPTTVHGSSVAMMVPTDASTKRFVFSGPSGTCWFDLVASPKPFLVPEQPPEPESRSAPAESRPAPAADAAPAAPDPAQDAWAAALAEAERQMAEQDAIEAAQRAAGGAAAAPAAARPPAGSGRGSRFVPLLLVFACGGWGTAAGVFVTSKKPAPAAHDHTEKAEEKAHEPKDPITRIDALIRKNKFEEALRECVAAPKEQPAPRETALALREALCLEGIGRWGESLEAYRRAEADPDAAVVVIALLGQARCATQDESYVLARALANRALLRSGHPGFRGARVREEVEHLRTRIAVQEGGAKPLPRDEAARPLLSTSATNGLDWLPTAPVAPAGGDTFEVHRTLGAPGALKVSAGLSQRPMTEVLRALAATAGWKVNASAEVVAKLKWAAGPIEVDHMALPEFLNVLTDGTGVSWSLQKDELLLTANAGSRK